MQYTTAPTPASVPTRTRLAVPTQRGARRQPPASGPGARLTVDRTIRVRCSKDLTRIHEESGRRRNLVKLAYLGGDVLQAELAQLRESRTELAQLIAEADDRDAARAAHAPQLAELDSRLQQLTARWAALIAARPGDAVLATLLKLAALPAEHPSVAAHGRRCWRLLQDADGWKLALELTGGPHGPVMVPGRDASGRPVGRRIDASDAQDTRTVARQLLAAAIAASENPDGAAPALLVEQLRRALS